ncbi:MAG: protein kinase [Gemmatimonadetes bacterium]|nr:protein kinase [Gemmatimonadota bacterium]
MSDFADFSDRYEIVREVGSGGMARVFLARDLKHDRDVAIKVLRPELSSGIGKERFLREIKLAARLTHPHILPLHDSGESDGALYFVMPYIAGTSLRTRLIKEGRLHLEDAIDITRAIAGALDYAHRHDVIHRDIKPENIMIHDGAALVTDFGIGKALSEAAAESLTQAGVLLGTPIYMSPEQVSGDPSIDGRSDIYSLGCVLYEMLAGNPPFKGETMEATLTKRLVEPTPDLGQTRDPVPDSVRHAVHKALAREVADRFATAADFAQALLPPTATQAATPTAATGSQLTDRRTPKKSIAVLPFTNMSPDPENEYFSDGISEEIINALAQLDDLFVAARSSSFLFRDKGTDIAEVGTKLNVATVLEGSVRKAGTRLRITAQLINVADGYHLWSERYDRNMDDVFAVQDEISTTIVERLRVTLSTIGDQPLVKPPTRDMEAYELYLKGRYMWNKRTKDGLQQAIALFDRAIERDANYALAYSGLADAYLVVAAYGHVPRAEGRKKAKAAARKAIELDETLSEAHTSLGQALRFDRDWWGEEQEYRRAIALNPNYATAHHWYATLLGGLGRLDEAVREIRRAEELDPFSAAISGTVGRVLMLARDYDGAIPQFEKTIELDPSLGSPYVGLAFIYAHMERYDLAVEWARKAVDLRPDMVDAIGPLGYVYGLSGQSEKARELIERGKAQGTDPGVVAFMYAGLHDNDNAFEWLERAFEDGSMILVFLKSHPVFDAIRSDPRFDALLERMGLPATPLHHPA